MNPRGSYRVRGPLSAFLRAVPSKSATHRALVAAALARGRSVVTRPLDADDTRRTIEGLSALGIGTRTAPGAWAVEGCGGAPPGGGRLQLGHSGTSLRLLLAVAALGARPSELDGSPRLRERPLAELVDALRELGASVEARDGRLPVVAGGRELHGGALRVDARRSSQFASALLLLGPHLDGGLELTLKPPAVSLPYVEMTARTMIAFGARLERRGELGFRVEPGGYEGRDLEIEGDHSSASYFLAAPAVAGGRVRVAGLDPHSAQPDRAIADVLRRVGCTVRTDGEGVEVEGGSRLDGFEADLTASPDLGPTLAVLALFAEGPSVLRGAAHLRHKESNRLELLAHDLRLLGRPARALDDRLEVGPMPPAGLSGCEIVTAGDHRMAMAFAIAGLALDGVTVDDTGCVAKSNPAFWDQLRALVGS
jgi:3-phosphoshikimate 1-carboxyvinyltransferase